MFISFNSPFYLVFLFAIPVLIFLHFFGLKSLRGKALKFANFEAIARIKGIDLYSKNISLLLFDVFFVVVLVSAMSGATLHKEVGASSFSFVIAIDSSASMSATDIFPDRISAAKNTALDFIDSSPYESPMGIISFSGNSLIEQEMTIDKFELKAGLEQIELSPIGGTDIYEAILVSAGLLNNEESKAIILLSDGQINAGNIGGAIDYAVEESILIHTLAIGTVEGGDASFGLSKLDEDSLKSIAYNSGGKYFNVKTDVELENSFNEILQVTRKPGEIDLSIYLLILALGLFIARQFLISINKILW